MNERVRQESKLTVLQSSVTGDRLKVERLRDALRDLLDPIIPVENLNADDICAVAMDFGVAQVSLREKLATIAKIKNFLGK